MLSREGGRESVRENESVGERERERERERVRVRERAQRSLRCQYNKFLSMLKIRT